MNLSERHNLAVVPKRTPAEPRPQIATVLDIAVNRVTNGNLLILLGGCSAARKGDGSSRSNALSHKGLKASE